MCGGTVSGAKPGAAGEWAVGAGFKASEAADLPSEHHEVAAVGHVVFGIVAEEMHLEQGGIQGPRQEGRRGVKGQGVTGTWDRARQETWEGGVELVPSIKKFRRSIEGYRWQRSE